MPMSWPPPRELGGAKAVSTICSTLGWVDGMWGVCALVCCSPNTVSLQDFLKCSLCLLCRILVELVGELACMS